MKTALGHVCKAGATRLLCRYRLAGPLAVLLGLTLHLSTARADTIFVTNSTSTNTIGEYTTPGATVNPALISGLDQPRGIAIVPTVAPEPSSFLLLVFGGLAVMIISIIRSARRMALARATKGEARLTAFNIEARREASLPSGA